MVNTSNSVTTNEMPRGDMVEGPAPTTSNATTGEMPRGEMTDISSGTMVGANTAGEMPRGEMNDAGTMGNMTGSGMAGEMPRGEMNESTFGSIGESELPLMEFRGDWRLILATTSIKRTN